MLVKKLRWAVGGLVVLAALGFIGLGYHAGDGPGSAQAAPPEKPRSELEALRRENELLKLNLEVVLEKVQAQETELRALRIKPMVPGGMTGGLPGMPGGTSSVFGGSSSGFSRGTSSSFPDGSSSLDGGIGGTPSGIGGGLSGTSGLGPMGPGRSGSSLGPSNSSSGSSSTGPQQPGSAGTTSPKVHSDLVKEAEAALKQLREARDEEGKRRATEALEKAVEKLKQKSKSKQE